MPLRTQKAAILEIQLATVTSATFATLNSI